MTDMLSGSHTAPTTGRARLQHAVRAAASEARTEIEFIRAVLASAEGIDIEASRWAPGGHDMVVGYRVRLREDGQSFNASTLASDLTLGKLRPRWEAHETDDSRAAALAHWRGDTATEAVTLDPAGHSHVDQNNEAFAEATKEEDTSPAGTAPDAVTYAPTPAVTDTDTNIEPGADGVQPDPGADAAPEEFDAGELVAVTEQDADDEVVLSRQQRRALAREQRHARRQARHAEAHPESSGEAAEDEDAEESWDEVKPATPAFQIPRGTRRRFGRRVERTRRTRKQEGVELASLLIEQSGEPQADAEVTDREASGLLSRLRAWRHRRQVTVVDGVEYPRRKPAPKQKQPKLTWRGWDIPGGGSIVRMDAPPEWRGPSTQVAGLYPFSTGTSLPMIGTPLGDNLDQRGTVCGDPISWYIHGLIANPSGFVLGRPGRGKSSLVNRMVIGCTWRGIIPIIPTDYKGEYRRTIEKLNGKSLSPRPKGDHVNPLDRGPLWALLAQLPDDQRDAAVADINLRRQNVLAGLCELALGRSVETHELNVLVRAMETWDAEHPDQTPLIGDLLAMVQAAPTVLQEVVHARGNTERYFARVEGVLDALTALAGGGYFGDMFACHTSIDFELGRPLCFDLSWLDSGDARMQAGVQLVLWSYTSAAVASAKFAAEGGLMPQQLYLLVFDELWRSLKTTSFMVHRINEITRLNRTLGLGQIMCTHTMEDLTLADEEASAVAQGFVERSEMVWMGGLAPAEMGNLARVFAMSRTEQEMLESWSVPGDINPATGHVNPPPGRGKFLMKVGQQTAVALQTRLTQAELVEHNTDEAWDDTRATQTGTRGRAA